ncbi:MAG: hypothetical protein IJ752_09695 [Alphaproteobacteria bacterium]|nr:hypothetical protein [Alphaproteobacteria bacterium]
MKKISISVLAISLAFFMSVQTGHAQNHVVPNDIGTVYVDKTKDTGGSNDGHQIILPDDGIGGVPIVGGGSSGNGKTDATVASCPQGTTLSSDKCCCLNK